MDSRYFIKRLIFAFITIFVVMLIIFFAKLITPTNEVEKLLSLQGMDENSDPIAYEKEYEKIYLANNLEKPLFYFSILPYNYPANINTIVNPNKKEKYKTALKHGIPFQEIIRQDDQGNLSEILKATDYQKSQAWIPKMVIHGFNNQFHHWFANIFTGNLGVSVKDGQPVLKKIGSSFKWTFGIVFINILLSIPIAILLGLYFYRKRKTRFAKVVDTVSVFLLSIPVFWLATLCVVYLTNDHYGLGIFKNTGLWHPRNTGFFENIDKLVLPIIILVILDVSYLIKLFKSSAAEENKKPYIQSLFAKGLTEKQALNNHIFKNAMIPIITLIVGAIPQALGGSLLLEVIFNIPGMGRLMYDSIKSADYSTSTAIILIVVLMTIISYFIGDVLYKKVNPKINFS